MSEHDSSEHDWEACAECVAQAVKDEVLEPGSEPFGHVGVEYHVLISVPEDEPAPTCADIQAWLVAGAYAIYQGGIDSNAIRVTSEGGAL